MRARLTSLIWNLCSWQLLKELIRFFFTTYICFINCKFILLSVTVSRGSLKWQASWISSSECYSCFSGKLKTLNPSVKGNYANPYCFACLLRQQWETKMFYHKIMSCEFFFFTIYAIKIHTKTGLIYNTDIKWENTF